MPQVGFDLLLPGIYSQCIWTKPLSNALSSLQKEQNLIRCLIETETDSVPQHISVNHLRRRKIFTAIVWALSFPQAIYLWAHII